MQHSSAADLFRVPLKYCVALSSKEKRSQGKNSEQIKYLSGFLDKLKQTRARGVRWQWVKAQRTGEVCQSEQLSFKE